MDLLELVWDLMRLPFLYAYDVVHETGQSLLARCEAFCGTRRPFWHPGSWLCVSSLTLMRVRRMWWTRKYARWAEDARRQQERPCGCEEE